MTDTNPHVKQMADESMVRNLAAQAEAIWPQERELLARYALSGAIRVLDAGCGTGEVSSRLAQWYPQARVLGVDILDHHLELARSRYTSLASRLAFEHRSVYALGLPDGAFDLTVCRHVTQSIPRPGEVLAELVRVTRPGGWLHVIAEDYGMLHFQRGALDARDFWHETSARFGDATGTDQFNGRNIYGLFAALGLGDVRIDYVVVDPLRVPRETFATILTAWRDGYAEAIGEVTRFTSEEAVAHFDHMIATVRDPRGYAVWMVPVASAQVPARS